MAIIGDPAQFKVYSVGDRLGALSLHAVYPDKVILERNGLLEALVLPRPASGAKWSVAAATPGRAGANRLAGMPAAAPPPPEALDAAIVDKVAESTVEEDTNGMIGIRVVPGADRDTFVHSGLIGGDVVVAVNGTRLDNADASENIWKQVSTGTTVTVLRRGKTQDVTLNFAP